MTAPLRRWLPISKNVLQGRRRRLETLQIVRFQAENFKRIKAIEIIPDGNTVIISGANEQGKTSVLDAIWVALGGADAIKGTNTIMPIRQGEKRASVTLDLGDIIVTRAWTSNDGKPTLKVENDQGAKFSSPQKMLDKLVGRLSFDPLAFAQQEDKDQLGTLIGLIELPVDPKELERQKKQIFDLRTLVNRETKQLEGQLAGMTEPDTDTPEKEVSAVDIMTQMQEASETLTANNLKRQELQSLGFRINQLEGDIKSIDGQIDELLKRIDSLKEGRSKAQELLDDVISKGITLQSEVKELKDPDTLDLQQQMTDVEKINKSVRDAKSYREVEQKLKTSKGESEKLTKQIEDIDNQKENMLKEAKLPIDGLGFNEQGVTFNGIPFKQCSSAERLKVSMAMAMALNPDLRVIRATDGSLLDSASMAIVKQMAKDNDFQVWLEVVDESGSMGVYIEDGGIAEKLTVPAVQVGMIPEPPKVKSIDDILSGLGEEPLF